MYKQKLLLLTLSAVVAALAGCSRDAAPPASAAKGPGPSPSVIPVPREFNGGKGYFAVSGATRVRYSGGAGAPEAANYFVEQAKANPELGLGGATEGSATSKGISFEITPDDQSLSDEGYTLKVTEDGAHVAARTPAGLFYGAVTLWQLLTVFPAQSGVAQIRAMEIQDSPRFAWRGLMLDSARHYQSPEYVKQFIDWMAQHKLNVLHWHLTDDQAWRLEIKKYPRLTDLGAWRVPAGQAPAANRCREEWHCDGRGAKARRSSAPCAHRDRRYAAGNNGTRAARALQTARSQSQGCKRRTDRLPATWPDGPVDRAGAPDTARRLALW